MSTPPTVYVSWQVALIDTLQQGFARLAHTITEEGQRMSEALDQLTAEVRTTNGVMQSAIVLIDGIAQRLAEAGTDEGKLEALRLDLEGQTDALAAAVEANQPPTTP
jgi:glycine/serine hydroxymethyltransferase